MRVRSLKPVRTTLSQRELQILGLVAEGYSNEEVATVLGLRPLTVKSHLQRVFVVLEANTRAHAVAICFRKGLLS